MPNATTEMSRIVPGRSPSVPLIAGAAASLLSTLALFLCGRPDGHAGAAPTNATSQWVWGRRALAKSSLSLRYTLVGYAVHHAMSTLWAAAHRRMHPLRARSVPLGRTLAEAAGTAAMAFAVDYTVTPRRLRPGFEHHLSAGSMLMVYAAFALGLAAAFRVMDEQQHRARRGGGFAP